MCIKTGDRVRISPRVDVYGMMGALVNKVGTVKEVKYVCAGQYEVAEIGRNFVKLKTNSETKVLEISMP